MLTIMQFGKNKNSNVMYTNAPDSSGGTKKRLLIIVGGAVLLLVVFGVVFSLLFGGDDKVAQQTLKLAQQHTELIRVAEIGTKQAKAQDTRNRATTAKLMLQSSQDQITAIAKRDQAVSSAQLAGDKSSKTDTALQTAEQTNRFDEVFLETLYTQLRSYQKTIKTTLPLITSSKDKQTLNDLHSQIDKLLPQTTQ
jgi:flagellar basal body-associated protein FliL